MKVSIITVCYNSEKYIKFAIESVVSQVYPDIEYIVIDGASTDSTMDIVNKYSKKIKHVVSESDAGIYDAMNKGISLATGEVIGILNSDDFYVDTQVLTRVMQEFAKKTEIDLLFANVDFVRNSDTQKVIRHYSSYRFKPWMLRYGFMPAHPATFVKKTAYDRVGLYKTSYRIAGDYEWFVRALLIKRLPFVKLNKTLIRMRLGGVSSSGFHSHILITKEMLASLKENNVYSNIIFVLARLPVKYFKLQQQKLRSYFHNHAS